MVGQPRPAGVPRLAVLLALSALLPAGAHAQTVAPGQAVTGAWRIEQARTEPIYDRRRARLDFGPEGRLVGHTSCNAISADYTLDGGRLRIGPVSTTRETCGRLQLEQEDRILTALELAATARVRDDGLLELRDADGRGVLRATRWTASE